MSDFNQAPVVPDSPSISTDEQTAVTINPALAVSDPDLDARNGGNGDYSGAAFTISRASASADDLFGFAADGAGFTVNGANLEVGGNVFASFVQSGGSLTINFTSSGAIATTALVNSVLEHLQYTNTSDEPPASVTLTYSLDDGAPANAAQGTVVNGNNIDSGEVTVSINAIDDGIAQNDEFTTDELTLVTGNVFVDNGSGPDSDPNGLTIVAVNGAAANVGSQITTGSGALLTVNADGSFSYDPNGAFEQTPTFDSGATNTPAADTFSYTLAGGQTATAVITIDGVDNNDLVFGSDGADVLTGGVGDDSLFGLDGDDLIRGRVGDDYIDGGDGFDRAGYYHTDEQAGGVHVDLTITGPQDTGSQGVDTLTSIEYVSGTPFADVLIGDDNDNVLWGSVATIDPGNWVSTSNNDTLDGGGGNDLLYVGIGNHSLTGGDGTDTVGFTENFGDDPAIHVSLALQGQAQDTGQGLWTLNGIENLSGGDDNDELTGDDNDNILAGSAGNDVLSGGGGNDQLYGDGLFDTSAPASGAPTLYPDTGANGNDVLEGGTGDDELYGGGGVDTASYEHASGGVQVVLYKNGGGAGDSTGADGEDLLSGIENLTGSAYDDILIGNNLDNVLSGGDGIDLLRGFAGNDTLQGGAGDDYLDGGIGDDILDGGDGWDRLSYFGSATGAVTIDLRIQGVAQDTGQGNDTLIGIEHVGGTVYGDTLTGNDGDNVIRGASDGFGSPVDHIDGQGGNDLISDGAGDHVLDGGAGTDTYLYEWVAVQSGINVSLALQGGAQDTGVGNLTLSNFENVTGTTFTDQLTGDGNANVLAGDLGDDVLSGGAGNDALYGDGRFYMDTHNSGLSGPIAFVNDSTSMYVGGVSGNDVLEGGLGDDLIDGGGGTDTASYLHASGGVTVDLSTGSASGADGNDTLVSIENVTGSAFGDSITGNFASNILDGRDGDDLIIARGGDDSLYGGNGNDFLSAGPGNDLINGGDGFDRAAFSQGATGGVTVDLRIQGVAQNTGIGSDTLIGIEYLSGSIFGDVLIGDDNNNYIWGVSDSSFPTGDTIDGQGGDDLIEVGAGDHILTGGTGNDTLLYNPFGTGSTGATISLALQGAAQDTGAGSMTLNGFENLSGGDFSDTLIGDSDNNVLGGALGDDTLVGGAGNDSLYGDGMLGVDSPNGGSGQITFFSDVGVTFGVTDGNDTLEGGLGNDLINGGGGIDTASYAHAGGGVTVDVGSGYAEGADGNDTLVGIENIIGSNFDDDITGDGGANVIDGLGGNDFIAGGGGDDTIHGGDGNDFIQGDFGENNISISGNDILYGDAGDDQLRGGLGSDFLYGGSGNDLLRGNGGIDYFDGGADDGEGFNGIGDRVSFYELRATQGVVADLRTGIISNDGFGNVETMVNIESLGAGTAYADIFYGNDGRNFLAADVGDQAYGFGGDDAFQLVSAPTIVDGGTGTDKLYLYITTIITPDTNGDGLAETIAAATSGFIVNLNTGVITDGYGNSGSITGIENIDGTSLGDTLTGDANANVLNGLDGNDTLEGGLGNDTLDGGNGTDTASYAHASGAVTVDLGAGTGTGADGSDTLANIENIIGSASDDSLLGDDFANSLTAGDGDDTLRGFGGNDTLLGGNGNDFIVGGAGDDVINGGAGYDRVGYFAGATTGVTVNLNIAGPQDTGQGIDTLVGIENVSGTVFADTLVGDVGDNWLWGSVGGTGGTNNDTLDGGGGNDLLSVGIGNHSLTGGTGIDAVRFTENGGTETGVTVSLLLQGSAQTTGNGSWTLTGIENLAGGAGADTLTGDGGNNVLAGNVGNDSLIGGGGDDVLLGDGSIDVASNSGAAPIAQYADITTVDLSLTAGNDILEGGLGNDTLNGGGGIDTASYAHASGAVTVTLTASGGSSSGADGLDTLVSIENVTGGASNDILNGNNNANTLEGGDGHDRLSGAGGNDILLGGLGDDSLDGGAGDDTLDGGAGFDRVTYNNNVNGVTVNLNLQGSAQNTGRGFDTLIGIEHVNGTVFADTIIGDGGDNWLWGFATSTNPSIANNNDYIDGGAGNDLIWAGNGNQTLIGGTGLDTVMYNENFSSDQSVTISLALQGTNQVTGQGTWNITGFENLVGGNAADVLTGDANDNIIGGSGGNDTLVGGAGNDTLWGDGEITIDSHGGNYPGPIINVPDAIIVFGGVSGNDIMEGGLGNDIIDGGGGTDTASYANASGSVSVTLTGGGAGSSSGADGNDTLSNIENLTGGGFNDSLAGDAGANVLDGGAGSDFIIGGLGDDTIIGGAGVDRAGYYQTNAALGGVTVNLAAGTASGSGGNDTLSGIENVSGTAFADTLTGDSGNNWLWGSAATYQSGASTIVSTTNNDRLDGGAGNDLLTVGKGNQILIGGTGNDTVRFTENGAAESNLTVSLANTGAQNTGNGTWTISGVENLSGGVGNDNLTGDDNANVLAGDSGGDVLSGGIGADTLYGDGLINVDVNGVTTIYGDGAATAGADNLSGGDGDDFLYGGGGNDVLKGDKDNDTLYGGTGNDTMTGGNGNDRYVIEANSGADTISGFAHVDKIVFDISSGVTSMTQLTMTKVGGTSTLISWGNGNSIMVSGLKPTDFLASDFQFSATAAGYEHSPHDFSAAVTAPSVPHDVFL